MGRELDLRNLDADTGAATKPGEYRLADKTYSKLLRQLAKDHFGCVTPGLRVSILDFYSHPAVSNWKATNKTAWRDTAHALEQLRLTPVSAEVAESCKPK
jgi:hypothetical protein